MTGWASLLVAYFTGGLTFIPLVLGVLLTHALWTSPYREDTAASEPNDPRDNIVQPEDDTSALEKAWKDDKKEKGKDVVQDIDTTSGYFAVCREYSPMGINAKPIERSTPTGSATVAAPSPSVYQTMYRSIFDRNKHSGPLESNNVNSRPKRAGNVFYVVLR